MRIKHYTDHQHRCTSCQSFDLNVLVFKEYFHVFFIPFFPAGVKSSSMYCSNCATPVRIDSLQKQYEEKTRIPFYLYTGLILIGCLVLWGFVANTNAQKQTKAFVKQPQAGDVYQMTQESNDSTGYYFLRVSRINGDTVFAWHNTLVYYGRAVYELRSDDHFTQEEELIFTKQELMKLLDKDELNTVYRNYGSKEGFDRVR
jgi:hypothetical protein